MTTSTQIFSARLYPRAAVENAAAGFREICDVRVEDDPTGTRATLVLPEGAGEDVMREFCNVALAAAVEIHLSPTTR